VALVRRGLSAPHRLLAALVFVLSTWALAAAPAGATELRPTDRPLPGSSFQGADGDQDDAAPPLTFIDWETLEAAGVVQHNPDPNSPDNAIKGKELNPGGWEITESGGNSPPKANIRDAWSAVRQPDGNTFLYLGFAREAEGGTTYLAFELNTDARLWDNDGNPATRRIPCRRTGDVLVAFEPHGNDPNVNVLLQRWFTEDTDPATGCARTGRLEPYNGLTENEDAQGATNDSEITSRLPGAYDGTIPTRRFGETALNLASLLEQAFRDQCLAFRSIWMHSRSSSSGNAEMQDYVAPRPLRVSTCSASGTKFFDRNANGERDPEDPGIPRFVIFADYDDDGRLDRREPRTVSDRQGHYVLHDIRPPDGTYRLRETLLIRRSRTAPVALDWICSFPRTTRPNGRFPCAWGPIDVSVTPNVEGRDFLNWFPARLTLRKRVAPPGDPGLFDLSVTGEGFSFVLPSVGGGRSETIGVPPGVYDISEVAAAGTDGAAYESSVNCRVTPARRGSLRPGTVWENLPLAAGDQATCTFWNIRPGSPAIAIVKVGPALATAGDTLRYTFYVTNPGDIPIPAAGVMVSDPDCDASPTLDEKQDASGQDGSPETLDPGDTWVYTCSNQTTDPGSDCEPSRVDNTGTVTGSVNGSTVPPDEDSISTILLCPDQPTPPTPEPPDPPGPPGPPGPDGGGGPGPVVPPGPAPPNAGDAAVARFLFRQATRRCITNRVPRVNFRGTHIRRVRIYVNGRLRRGLTVQTLQRRVTPRVTLAPGRYRVTARVTFQRGAGTPGLTLSRVIRICGVAARQPAPPPPVTG
jgi:uncharacterized repeat protein (TIGR01451 family)